MAYTTYETSSLKAIFCYNCASWAVTHLVPHNGSPIDWSLWTNGPQKFGPHGQMVPNLPF